MESTETQAKSKSFCPVVQDVSDAPAHFDGNPQYSVRRGLPILAVFAPIISQGYSEVESRYRDAAIGHFTLKV